MYFSIKAFSPSARRFENLDNLQELNDFVNEYVSRGFTKFIVKSYDENGPRFTSFFSTIANSHSDCAKGLGGAEGFAVRVAKCDLIEA
jgi:uncharacterized protein YutD